MRQSNDGGLFVSALIVFYDHGSPVTARNRIIDDDLDPLFEPSEITSSALCVLRRESEADPSGSLATMGKGLQHRGHIDLPRMTAQGMDSGIERPFAAARRIQAMRSTDRRSVKASLDRVRREYCIGRLGTAAHDEPAFGAQRKRERRERDGVTGRSHRAAPGYAWR